MTFYHDRLLMHTPCFYFSLTPAVCFFNCFSFLLLSFPSFHLAVEIIDVIGEQNIFLAKGIIHRLFVSKLSWHVMVILIHNIMYPWKKHDFRFVLDKRHKWSRSLLSGEITEGWDNCQKRWSSVWLWQKMKTEVAVIFFLPFELVVLPIPISSHEASLPQHISSQRENHAQTDHGFSALLTTDGADIGTFQTAAGYKPVFYSSSETVRRQKVC